MKKEYLKPEVEEIEFKIADIITDNTVGGGISGTENPGWGDE